MTAGLYEYAKNCTPKHIRVYSSYQKDIELEAFNRGFVTHRKAVSTALKRTLMTSDWDGREQEEILKEDLEKNVTLCHRGKVM